MTSALQIHIACWSVVDYLHKIFNGSSEELVVCLECVQPLNHGMPLGELVPSVHIR